LFQRISRRIGRLVKAVEVAGEGNPWMRGAVTKGTNGGL
jgi:hypothetical protein